MNKVVQEVFQKNIRILDWISRAVIYFREGNYDKAIESVAEVTQDITEVANAIEQNREYFSLVSIDSVSEMLEGILGAKHSQDFVLLADLLELQMDTFICNVQAYIMRKEDLFLFDEACYLKQIHSLINKMENKEEFLEGFTHDINPAQLLDDGYRVELTSCGLMTVVKKDCNGMAHYLHTNHKISQEAFLLARSYLKPDTNTYYIAGLGLGYHVLALSELAPQADIKVIESDKNIFKLCCAFSDLEKLLQSSKISFCYDAEGRKLAHCRENLGEQEALYIHYPSYGYH